jgi:hypothetical protein
MKIKDGTEALSEALAKANPDLEEVESIHQAEIDSSHMQTLLDDPKLALRILGVKTSDESQVQVTMKHRAQRDAKAVALRRRIIIIIIHYRNCDADIIIIA